MRFVDGFQTKAGLRSAWGPGDVSAQQSPVPQEAVGFLFARMMHGGFGKKCLHLGQHMESKTEHV